MIYWKVNFYFSARPSLKLHWVPQNEKASNKVTINEEQIQM